MCTCIYSFSVPIFVQMTQEINIHRAVLHKHIVGFHGFFEDDDNVYILLELCRRRVS
jgi:polo-like kinase 1